LIKLKYVLLGAALVFCVTACGKVGGNFGFQTQTTYNGNPDIFMMGQSNADDRLAAEIADATGKTLHQINHTGQPIQHWFKEPYNWLETDMEFLGNRTFQYFIWFQGEANLRNRSGYETLLKQIIAAASPEQEPVVIIVGIWVDSDVDPTDFREDQMDMCDRNENFHFVNSKGCPRSDWAHLSASGRILLAERINHLITTRESGSK